jgi:hypothetical protein
LAGAVSVACSLQNLDYLNDEPWPTNSAVGGSTEGGGVGAGGTDGDPAGSAGAGGADNGGGSAGAAGSSSNYLFQWNFDDSAEAAEWMPKTSSVTLSWVAVGEKDPLGSMSAAFTAATEVEFDIPATDLTGHVIRARVRVESGTATIKLYLMSMGWIWADGGQVMVGTNWLTSTFNVDAPSFASTGFDATQIVGFGFHSATAGTVYVDSFWVE